ncbi:MAG TPA: isoaspartyl peptidase/L-asparaginase, partial [Pilimelia sp.]|nr:isoaspartyl peptidase/L-asparaginase [Pilimelia sp.]
MTGFVALHGGVGEELSDGFIAGLHRAADAAATTLAPAARPPGAVLDAVVAAVTVLEADPEYNAGYGAVLNE